MRRLGSRIKMAVEDLEVTVHGGLSYRADSEYNVISTVF